MNEVNFKVLGMEKANKPGYVVARIQFEDSFKVFTYVRKAYGNLLIIDGCKISYDKDYNVTSVEREYETKGVKHVDTSNVKSTHSKIKEAVENNHIQIPEIIPAKDNEEVHHEKYDQIKACLQCGIPVYLAGPAGSGKNYTVEQIAKELGWNFYFSNSVQQEYKLTGFIDAGGCFHDTEFYKACNDDKDCIFFLDEMDASIPEVLVLLNAAIANKYFEFPNGRVNFEHVHFVAAGNTVGSGADDMYTGRMVIDQATLDRFAIIEFDYSRNIEMQITHNNMELVEFIHQLRNEAKNKGIRATFSYRCMTMVTKLEKTGMDLQTIIKVAVVKGLDKDTISTLYPSGNSKYHKALYQVRMAA
jgi:cobaltochelatase CobS